MSIQILSDLHLEFHADGGASFIESLDPTGVDALAIAGDLIPVASVSLKQLRNLFKAFAARYPEVIYVPGNHEFYGTSILQGMRKICNATKGIKNFFAFLNGRRGRVVGGTMWFPPNPANAPFERMLNDYRQISDIRTEVPRQALGFRRMLEKHLEPGDIVITHHAPSYTLAARGHNHPEMNCFYCNPMDDLIISRRPALWIYGHTHETKISVIGRTPCVTNAFGYVLQGENTGFRDKLVWSVSRKRLVLV